jgi:hypothetical protein
VQSPLVQETSSASGRCDSSPSEWAAAPSAMRSTSFSCYILTAGTSRIPRHGKRYADLAAEGGLYPTNARPGIPGFNEKRKAFLSGNARRIFFDKRSHVCAAQAQRWYRFELYPSDTGYLRSGSEKMTSYGRYPARL